MKAASPALFLALLLALARGEVSEDGLSFITNHGSTIPLVGVGVGNLAHESIPDVRSPSSLTLHCWSLDHARGL